MEIGTQLDRKLQKYSESFNKIFNFFSKSHRRGLLCFSGSEDFKIVYDPDGPEAKNCYRKFENGQYEREDNTFIIKTRHPNLLYSVIKGKKSWGLWKNEWVQGILEHSFTREEILGEFEKYNIEIPEAFLTEFDNLLKKEKQKKIEKEIERLHSGGMWK